jgi:hypothetical protein
MKLDILKYNKMMVENNITVIYSGPIWEEGLEGLASTLQNRLALDDLPLNVSQSIFSIFIEQVSNIMLYSAEKEIFERTATHKQTEVAKGVFILGALGKTYFLQSGNVVTNINAEILKTRIDQLNSLDKQELRHLFKEQAKAENMNAESKGAGLGLIEIARRATSKIDYEFLPYGEGLSYFTMYVRI